MTGWQGFWMALALVATASPAWAAGKGKPKAPASEAAEDKSGCAECCKKCECATAGKGEDRDKAADKDADKEHDAARPDAGKTAADKDKPTADKGGPGQPGADKSRPVPAPPAPPAAASRTGTVKEFPAGSPDAVLREAFKCALDMDDASGFACYAALNVESNRDNDIATAQLRNYQWRFFRQRAATYVVEGKEFAIQITRRDPDHLDASSKEAKLFLRSKARDNPAPVIFRKEDGKWRIYSSSL